MNPDDEKTPLDLDEADIAAELEDQDDASAPDQDGEDEGETVIGFSDEEEDGEEEPSLVKSLRQQVRELTRKVNRQSRVPEVENDPEPQIPPKRKLEEFDYDQDKLDEYLDEREAAIVAHAEWKLRAKKRDEDRQRQNEEQTRAIEQQRKALGVSDYDEKASAVREVLSDAQVAILINGADNPARMLYALGRSPERLAALASENNLAKFAVAIGKLEKDIKVRKKAPPAVESRVRGATGSFNTNDRELERLEREAERTGDRTEVQRYKREMRKKAAA